MGVRSPGAGVTSGSESHNVIAGKGTQVFGKSSCSSPLSSLSNPCGVLGNSLVEAALTSPL